MVELKGWVTEVTGTGPGARGVSVGVFMLGGMTPWTLSAIEDALRTSWAADTCSPDDVARDSWTSDNPAWGHCDITALVVNDLFGGDLMVGEVYSGRERQGYHWWNRLPTGVEIDLTADQFRKGQRVTPGRVVRRPTSRPSNRFEEYQILLGRTLIKLDLG